MIIRLPASQTSSSSTTTLHATTSGFELSVQNGTFPDGVLARPETALLVGSGTGAVDPAPIAGKITEPANPSGTERCGAWSCSWAPRSNGYVSRHPSAATVPLRGLDRAGVAEARLSPRSVRLGVRCASPLSCCWNSGFGSHLGPPVATCPMARARDEGPPRSLG